MAWQFWPLKGGKNSSLDEEKLEKTSYFMGFDFF
ncbi:hypothetical protein N480_21540 [Pseudoalteromonas luteoviolacea S2607]|nr:hypothetical protein N480_21540 [Pseudoalteromonas luteoviolacea S2607]